MSVRIITDSASDMSPAEHPALRVLPLSVTFGTDVYMDGVDIDHQRFYEMLVERDELPKTGQVNPYAFSQAIAEARDKGDLSENAEYDAAREAQGLLEMRIAKLEDTIANARVIDESKIDKSKVQILSKVTLLNHNNNKQMVYTIVAEHEANLREGKLAIGTPIAKALLGHKKGDRVDVEVPAGTIHFEILDISI